jgi:phage shock protein PspC (stress-responsive transcriptional regulator)
MEKIMKKLYRSRKDRLISGVCGGLGNYIRIDPTIVRFLFICLCIFTGILPLVIGYIIACIIIPLESINSPVHSYKRLYRSRTNRRIAGICGGLSVLIKVDATLIRVVFVVLCFITGIVPLVLLYLIGWALIPEVPARHDTEIIIEEKKE